MNDDISFIPETISIMSKLKDPTSPHDHEHSLSKIIRQQGLKYEPEIQDEEILFHRDDRNIDKRKQKVQKQTRTTQNNRSPQDYPAHRDPHRRQPRQFKDAVSQNQLQTSQRKVRDAVASAGIRSTERKGNILLFEESEGEPLMYNIPKKEKRVDKTGFDEQKTKKLQFQDIDRFKYQQKAKKSEPTKIRQKIEDSNKQYQGACAEPGSLQICSKDGSEDIFESRDLNALHQRALSNYNTLISQIKQMMGVTRWQYIQLQKIEIRKMISKLQADIRRAKIGFRGLSDSCGKSTNLSSLQGGSKLISCESSEAKTTTRKKTDQTTNKVQSRMKMKSDTYQQKQLGFDYGLSDKTEQMSLIMDSHLKDKLQKLEQECKNQRTKENKFTAKLLELEGKYSLLRNNNFKKEDSGLRRTQGNLSASIIKRGKILKEKQVFLKGQVKESKAFYSNKIKRLKNQNTILSNELKYIQREIEEMKRCAKNVQKQSKKISSDQVIAKPNVYLFEEEPKKLKNIQRSSKVLNFNKDQSSNITSLNDIKSLQSINSIKSINSKPSLASLNYKSTKMQSQQKNSVDYQYPKVKLKINTPHYVSPPSTDNSKQYSILNKRKLQTENKLGKDREKKSISLDLAFKQLQQKYSKHLPTQKGYEYSDYYNGGK